MSRQRHPRKRTEHGGATAMVVTLMVALLVAAGVVIDGGYALSARREAMSHAEQAARAGSDALNQASLRNGTPAVSTTRARNAAQHYLTQVGAQGVVEIDGGDVTVTVSKNYDTAVLSIVGLNQLNVRASATALSIDEDDNP